jgi:hypothetical protein
VRVSKKCVGSFVTTQRLSLNEDKTQVAVLSQTVCIYAVRRLNINLYTWSRDIKVVLCGCDGDYGAQSAKAQSGLRRTSR